MIVRGDVLYWILSLAASQIYYYYISPYLIILIIKTSIYSAISIYFELSVVFIVLYETL